MQKHNRADEGAYLGIDLGLLLNRRFLAAMTVHGTSTFERAPACIANEISRVLELMVRVFNQTKPSLCCRYHEGPSAHTGSSPPLYHNS